MPTLTVGAAPYDAGVTMSNSGTGRLTWSNITTDNSVFTLIGNTPTSGTLEPGASLPITVRFTPPAVGTYTGTLTVTSDATSGTGTMGISGRVASGNIPPPATRIIRLETETPVPDCAVGSKCSGYVRAYNDGNTTLSITTIDIADSSVLTPNSGSFPGPAARQIPAGQYARISIEFAPTVEGSATGTLRVSGNETSGSPTMSITARTPTRVIGLSGSLTMPTLTVLSGPYDARITMSNSGTGRLTWSNITTGNSVFTLIGNTQMSGTLEPGASTTIEVRFTPPAVGTYTGTLTVTSNATSGTGTMAISGTVISTATGPAISLDGDLDFGSVAVNTSATKTLHIVNTGDAPLSISGLTYSNSAFRGAYNGTLDPQGGVFISITFAPLAAVTYRDTITVASDSRSGSNVANMSGTGTSPIEATRIIRMALDTAIPTTAVGSRGYGKFRIYNDGNDELSIQGGAISPYVPLNLQARGTIAPGAYLVVDMEFIPESAGTFTTTVTVESNKTGGTNTIAITATATAALGAGSR